MEAVMNMKTPLSQRVNFRLIIFVSVMLLVIGYPIYLFVDEAVTGGIHDHAGFCFRQREPVTDRIFAAAVQL